MFPNNTISNVVNIAGLSYWYASQLGAGTKDGTSEANASDVSGIPYASMGVRDSLYLMDTITDSLSIGASDIDIRGDLSGRELVLDATSQSIGLTAISKTGVKIYGGTYTNATVSNLSFEGSSEVETFNLVATDSGNQNLQHLDDTVAVHNNLTATGGIDDGVSGHERANITISGNDTNISGNNQGVNVVEHCVLTINCNIGANTQDDVSIVNNFGSGLVTATLNNCSAGTVIGRSGSKIVLNNANITTVLENDGGALPTEIEANDSVIEEYITNANSTGNFTQCLIKENIETKGTQNFYKSRLLGNTRLLPAASLELKWCLLSNENSNSHTIDTNNTGSLTASYNVVSNILSNKFGILSDTGSVVDLNNNTFLSDGNIGRGMYSNIALTTANNIFSDLNTGCFARTIVPTLENNCFFNNNTDVNGTATNNDVQSTSPLLVDVTNNDFSIGAGSSCIGTGETLTQGEGIDTASWGNGVNESPTVTTKTQGDSWDIGAYIS